jgi:integrase
MAYAEKRGKGARPWRVRYKRPDGEYESESGFATKKAALAFGNDQESEIRRRSWIDPRKGEQLVQEWAESWYDAQDLELTTLERYEHRLRKWILPRWGHYTMAGMLDAEHEIGAWEKQLRADSSQTNATACRRLLSTLLGDAVPSVIPRNPALRGRARGRVAERRQLTQPEEKAWITPFQLLRIAERAALVSGRDDEFIFLVTAAYTGMRFGEVVGLEHAHWRMGKIDIEHQLHTLSAGPTIRKDPKDGSVRTIDVPPFLVDLLSHQAKANPPRKSKKICECIYAPQLLADGEEDPDYLKQFVDTYGHREGIHLFRGPRSTRAARGPVTQTELARRAGVSTGTVSFVLHHPERVSDALRERVQKVMKEAGYTLTEGPDIPHLARGSFPSWVLGPAASGWNPVNRSQEARPVPLGTLPPFPPNTPLEDQHRPLAHGPWTAVQGPLAESLDYITKSTSLSAPCLGGGSAHRRATVCWLPVEPDLTMHGLRHSHKTWMDDDRIPDALKDERMGHIDNRVQAVYSHVSDEARQLLMDALTRRWKDSLREFAALRDWSPVPVLHELLQAELRREEAATSRFSQISPKKRLRPRGIRKRNTA